MKLKWNPNGLLWTTLLAVFIGKVDDHTVNCWHILPWQHQEPPRFVAFLKTMHQYSEIINYAAKGNVCWNKFARRGVRLNGLALFGRLGHHAVPRHGLIWDSATLPNLKWNPNGLLWTTLMQALSATYYSGCFHPLSHFHACIALLGCRTTIGDIFWLESALESEALTGPCTCTCSFFPVKKLWLVSVS